MSHDPLFPVAVKDGAFRAPAAPSYYVLAANGLFLVRRTELFTACVPVAGGVPGLLPQEAELHLALPRLPRVLLERAVTFFRDLWQKFEGEGIVVLFLAPPVGERPARYALAAPPQRLRGRFEGGRFRAELRLDYGACERPGPEFRKLGTIHSHGSFGPRHSVIDAHDELYETGLHVTAGYVDSARPEFEASFVVGRTRFAVPVEQVLPRFRTCRRWPPAWMERVTLACNGWGDARAALR